jgi:hypothetical protein
MTDYVSGFVLACIVTAFAYFVIAMGIIPMLRKEKERDENNR